MTVFPTTYDPREYWSAVAEEIRARPDRSLLAGDDSPFLRYKREVFLDRILRTMPVRDRAVLEVGCGPGANLLEVAKAGPRRLVGCDISPAMIELAGETTASLPDVELVELRDTSLPFETGELEVSYSVTVLQHNVDDTVQGLVAEMARVTSAALYLVEDTTRASRRLERLVGSITGGAVTPESFHLRRVSDYAQLCAAHGFDLVEARPLGVFASDVMRVGVWFLDSRLARSSKRREGERLNRFQARAEERLLPLTKALDPRVPQGFGLTAMRFQRRSASSVTTAS